MSYAFFALVALIHLGFLAYSFRLSAAAPLVLIRALLAGLIVDNAILAAGVFGIDTAAYQIATVARYAIHAVLLPLILLMGLAWLRRAGVAVARQRWFTGLVVTAVILAVAYGLATDVIGLSLEPAFVMGHARLVSSHPLPPLATIVSNLLLILMAVALWRRAGWPWLLAGSGFIFLVNGATATRDWSVFTGNLAELIFVATLLATQRFVGTPGKQPGD